VDLPSVGTNLQDQALVINAYNITVNNNIINSPQIFVGIFADYEQVLGAERAKSFAEELKTSIPERAAAIVASGAFTSVEGMSKILEEQAMQIVDQKGSGNLTVKLKTLT